MGVTGRLETGRLKTRNQVHALMDQHFDMGELEQVAFEAGMNVEKLSYRSKSGLIREMILHSLHNNGVSRLVEVLQRERPFVEWPVFS